MRFPLRPLRTDADLEAAVAVIDALIDQDELTAPEQDYFDVRTIWSKPTNRKSCCTQIGKLARYFHAAPSVFAFTE